MRIKGRKNKKCPRCKNECLLSQVQCDECGLLFARVEEATNKEGKRRLFRGQKEQVIYVSKYPKDVKKWKMILLVFLTGLCGGHYFYVGKWIKGFIMLVYFFAVILLGVVFNAYMLNALNGNFFSIFGPLTGIYVVVWIFDIYRVCFSRFKIPVSIISEKEESEYQTLKKEKKEKKKQPQKEDSKQEEKIVLEEKKAEDKTETKKTNSNKQKNSPKAKLATKKKNKTNRGGKK